MKIKTELDKDLFLGYLNNKQAFRILEEIGRLHLPIIVSISNSKLNSIGKGKLDMTLGFISMNDKDEFDNSETALKLVNELRDLES